LFLAVCFLSILGLGCQPITQPIAGDSPEDGSVENIDVDALIEGSWEIERANVTFFDPDTLEVLAGPVDVFADQTVPVYFHPGGDPTALSFGGSFHFGEGASRWYRIYLTIIENGEYVRNADEEFADHPPPFDDPLGGESDEYWEVDEGLRLVVQRKNPGDADFFRVEAMVDMADDGETVWLDYDREAQEFSDRSCINSVHLRRVAVTEASIHANN